jgi:hypothetical protein
MKFRLPIAAIAALGLVGATAPVAGAALPRPGYWEARIGNNGPLVRFLIAPSRRQVVALQATVAAMCDDGHTHVVPIKEAVQVPIDARGRFSIRARFSPPLELDHPGLQGWDLHGRFTSATALSGTVSVIVTPPGEVCTSPPNRRTWSGHPRANPALGVVRHQVRRRGLLTLLGSGYLPRLSVHVIVPTDVIDAEAGRVDQQTYLARTDTRGRFRFSVRVPFNMPFGNWRAQAWQLECLTVCWVYAQHIYRVAS